MNLFYSGIGHRFSEKFLWSFQLFQHLKLLFFSFSFSTQYRGVGQRSGTELETPLLSWALPLKILKYMSLGVDVPLFSTRVLIFYLF